MKTDLFEELKSSVKNWWVSLIVGILFVVFALILMYQPVDAFVALSLFFSICIFVCGVFEILFAFTNKGTLPGWGWYLTCGIIDLLIGIFLMCRPEVSMLMIPMIIAFWLMFRGITAVGLSIDLQRFGSKNWGWYLVFGILAVLCSLGIIVIPAAGALTAVYMAAFAFLFIGVFRIMLSFDLKNLKEHNDELKERIDALHKIIK